jgi:hypothetical protein
MLAVIEYLFQVRSAQSKSSDMPILSSVHKNEEKK